MHPMCCVACCHSISELYAMVDECFQATEAMRRRMRIWSTWSKTTTSS
jgi:hypothetical protein